MDYIHVSMDILHNRNKEEALIRECIAEGRNVVCLRVARTVREGELRE